jgi:hypothetical protein
MINKKGATYGTWIELIIFVVLFVGVLGILSYTINNNYGTNIDLSYGINSNDTINNLKSLQVDFDDTAKNGQASFSSLGIFMLTTIPKMIMTVTSMVWGFVAGSWINSIVGLMNLGDYAGLIITLFKLLYFIAIGFILIKIVTRIVV